jgi:hypothetical protein
VADVGFNEAEEVDIVTPGANLGWNYYEGNHLTNYSNIPITPALNRTLTFPIYAYDHIYGPGEAIIGGYYIDDIGYVFGDLTGILFRIIERNGSWQLQDELRIDNYIKSFARDARGNLYVLTSKNVGPGGRTGALYRIRI